MIYKYFSPQRSIFFDNFLIRFSQPKYLNDPEDCLPLFRIKNINSYVDKITKRNLTKAFLRGVTLNNISQAKQKLLFDYKHNPLKILGVAQEIYLNNINSILGILCLSKSPFIKLLWSYYCDSYKGFVIEFDERNEFFRQRKNDRPGCGKLFNVKYQTTRPIIFVDDLKIDIIMLTTKIIDWDHEEEVRIFRELKNSDKKYSPDIHLFQVPKSAITKIIFGLRFDPVTQPKFVKQVMNDYELAHVNFGKINIDNNGQLFIDKI